MDDIESLARMLLDIQMGSVEEALLLAQDYPDGEEKDKLIAAIERIGENDNG